MKRLNGTVLMASLLTFSVAVSVWAGERRAPLFDNLGSTHFAITTKDPLVQRYFNQGFILAIAFNHAEAERSFREAARLDPACAMCYWGVAWVLGPNLNAPMEDLAVPKAHAAIQRAQELKGGASELEQALIEAMAQRYSKEVQKDRSALDRAYADAMREVTKRYPEDLHTAALFANALMDLHPWDFWTKDKKPKPWTPEIVSTLEAILAKTLDHPLANHLYIHAVEASDDPGRAEAAADRLASLAPGAGHLVHMPGHIYINIGRYKDAAKANLDAIAADQEYLRQVKAQGLYPLAYVPHKHHFLWAAAMMSGKSELAIQAARGTAENVDKTKIHDPVFGGTLQHFYSMPLYAFVRFGKWDAILKEPKPEKELIYPAGVWHFARGMAQVRKGNITAAQSELDRLQKTAKDPAIDEMTVFGLNRVKKLLRIGAEILSAELAEAAGRQQDAIDHLTIAAGIEDALIYNEPPDWSFPVRHALGAVLLEAGKFAKAEAVYREDLEKNKGNGWGLYGLQASLKGQGKTEAAAEVEKQFEQSWSGADVKLASSRF